MFNLSFANVPVCLFGFLVWNFVDFNYHLEISEKNLGTFITATGTFFFFRFVCPNMCVCSICTIFYEDGCNCHYHHTHQGYIVILLTHSFCHIPFFFSCVGLFQIWHFFLICHFNFFLFPFCFVASCFIYPYISRSLNQNRCRSFVMSTTSIYRFTTNVMANISLATLNLTASNQNRLSTLFF